MQISTAGRACCRYQPQEFEAREIKYANGTQVKLPFWKVRMVEFYRSSSQLGRSLNVSKCLDQTLGQQC